MMLDGVHVFPLTAPSKNAKPRPSFAHCFRPSQLQAEWNDACYDIPLAHYQARAAGACTMGSDSFSVSKAGCLGQIYHASGDERLYILGYPQVSLVLHCWLYVVYHEADGAFLHVAWGPKYCLPLPLPPPEYRRDHRHAHLGMLAGCCGAFTLCLSFEFCTSAWNVPNIDIERHLGPNH